MQQGALPFQYEIEGGSSGLTALAGLPVYLELAAVMGLRESIEEHVKVRCGRQGWTDSQILMSLVLLNIAGGNCVEDLKTLEADEGFGRILRRSEHWGLSRRERREMERRWRKERCRVVPSSSATFRYLEKFHDPKQEVLREQLGQKPDAPKAFIPAPNKALRGLSRVNRDLLAFAAAQGASELATLDTDATISKTTKASARYCYKHVKAYQPLNVCWAEQGLMVHTEFRDGNVPAGYEQRRVFEEALSQLPAQVKKVRARSDTAGYQHELLRYLDQGKNERFGRIEFAFSSDVTTEFKRAVAEVPEEAWHKTYRVVHGRTVEADLEWAEVCFVPSDIAKKRTGLEYRYLATREPMLEQELPGMESQKELPFPTMRMVGAKYKVFGIVTNMDWEGERLIRWLHERCGKSEEAHAVLKNDLAGGHFPSQHFGANAAWWWITVLAHNLNAIMKRHVLRGDWMNKRMKAIRFALINLPGRVLEHARRLIIRLTQWQPMIRFLMEVRCRIVSLVPVPTG